MTGAIFLLLSSCCLMDLLSSLPAPTTTSDGLASSVHALSDRELQMPSSNVQPRNSSKGENRTQADGDRIVAGDSRVNETEEKKTVVVHAMEEKEERSNHHGGTGASNDAAGFRNLGGAPQVMSLSDDVITDALFTNIDTLQDQLEVCEEGLRQQLKHHSHGKLMQQVKEEEDGMSTEKYQLNSDEEDDHHDYGNESEEMEKDHDETGDERVDSENAKQSTGPYDDDEDVDGDYDDENDDYDNKEDKDAVLLTDKKSTPAHPLVSDHTRVRRSAGQASNNPRTLPKSEALAQKVVSRLSARLTYLKSSLVQCHLLFRQFGSL